MKLTQEKLKEILHYNPNTGIFTWIKSISNRIRCGEICSSVDGYGYIRIGIHNKRYKAHRLVFLYMKGYLPENDVDHIDRDPSNNKWDNLREVSKQCNMRNCSISKNNISGIVGVHWDKGVRKWRSHITVDKKAIYIGIFKYLKDAVKARWCAEVKYNFPNCNTTSSAYLYLKNNNLI